MRPPEGSPCPTRRPPEAASARRSPSRGPSGASPGPSAGRRTSSSEEGGLLRDTSCPWKKSSMTFSTGFYTPHPAARHLTPVLTMNVYARASLLDVAGAVEGVGEMLPRPEGARSGTLGHHCGLSALRSSRPQKRENPRETRETPGLRRGQGGEAPVGVEPTMADLQSAALATWLRSRNRQGRHATGIRAEWSSLNGPAGSAGRNDRDGLA